MVAEFREKLEITVKANSIGIEKVTKKNINEMMVEF